MLHSAKTVQQDLSDSTKNLVDKKNQLLFLRDAKMASTVKLSMSPPAKQNMLSRLHGRTFHSNSLFPGPFSKVVLYV